MSNQVISNCLTEVVAEKVIADKYKAILEEKGMTPEQLKAAKKPVEEQKADILSDSDPDLDDEEIRKIMIKMKDQKQKEIEQVRKQKQETFEAGDFREIAEDEFLNYVTKNHFAAVHFYHRDFQRCKIMDKHLQIIAYKHGECRFLKMNAEKAPFFIQKLAIKTLPTVVCFKDGVAVDRVVGFEDLGNNDDFDTILLARRLVKAQVITAKTKQEKGFNMKIIGKRDDNDSADDELG